MVKVARTYLILAILALALMTPAYALEESNIYDNAEVLSDKSCKFIDEHITELKNELDIQMIVCTMSNSKGYTAKGIAIQLAKGMNLSGDDVKSVVIVLATDIREVYVYVSDGLRAQLSDSNTKIILDTYGVPSFTEDEFDTGTSMLFTALYSYLAQYSSNLEPLIELPEEISTQDLKLVDIIMVCMILIPILALVAIAFGSGHRNTSFDGNEDYDIWCDSGDSSGGGAGSSF